MSHVCNLNGKINNKNFKSSGAKTLESVIHCSTMSLATRLDKSNSPTRPNRSISGTQSVGNFIKNQESGFKQKLVNKVKSWSNRDKVSHNEPSSSKKPDLGILSSVVENLTQNNGISEENIYQSEIFNAKDSLESILVAKTDMCKSLNVDFKSVPLQEVSEILHPDPTLTLNIPTESSVKQLTWDPWNKLGRKNKKDKRRKEKSPHTSSERSVNISTYKKGNDHTAGDEPQINTIESNQTNQRSQVTYEYQTYKSKRKSVEFLNEVSVMYFTGDEIISKVMEPLKKELDQQTRNKEMRRGHVPCTLLNKKEVRVDDYMSTWLKK